METEPCLWEQQQKQQHAGPEEGRRRITKAQSECVYACGGRRGVKGWAGSRYSPRVNEDLDRGGGLLTLLLSVEWHSPVSRASRGGGAVGVSVRQIMGFEYKREIYHAY